MSAAHESHEYRIAYRLRGGLVEAWVGPHDACVAADPIEAKNESRQFSADAVEEFQAEFGCDAVNDAHAYFQVAISDLPSALLKARNMLRRTERRWPSATDVVRVSEVRMRDEAEEREESQEGAKKEHAKAQILDDVDEHRVINETVTALATLDDLYVMGPQLVELDAERNVHPIAKERARDLATLAASFYKLEKTKDGGVTKVEVHPPFYLGAAIIKRPSYPDLEQLIGVVRNPVLRPDATVIETAGYDASTRLYYAPTVDFPAVPKAASVHAARSAYRHLAELFRDFPYEDRELGIAVAIAFILTFLARHLIDCVPAKMTASSQPGSGKGLETDVITIVGCGACLARSPWSGEPDEQRKLLEGQIRRGARGVLLDNITAPLGGPDVERIVTSTTVDVRVLGRTETASFPNAMTILATANNPKFVGDMPRRVAMTRHVPRDDKPDARTDFHIALLREHVTKHRARYAIDALTILVAHARAGRPAASRSAPWGSFEQWTSIVADAVVFAGGADPLRARVVRDERTDTVREALDGLIRVWLAFGGVVGVELACSQFLDRCSHDPEARLFIEEVLDEQAPARSEKQTKAARLSAVLTRHADRWVSVNVGTAEKPHLRLLGFARGSSGMYGRRWKLAEPKAGA